MSARKTNNESPKTRHAFIMRGRVWGGPGTECEDVDICTEFESAGAEWLSEYNMLTRVEHKILAAIKKKCPKKRMFRFLFNKVRAALPDEPVDMILNKPILRPNSAMFMCKTVENGECQICIDFKTKASFDKLETKLGTPWLRHILLDAVFIKTRLAGVQLAEGYIPWYPLVAMDAKVDLKINLNKK